MRRPCDKVVNGRLAGCCATCYHAVGGRKSVGSDVCTQCLKTKCEADGCERCEWQPAG